MYEQDAYEATEPHDLADLRDIGVRMRAIADRLNKEIEHHLSEVG